MKTIKLIKMCIYLLAGVFAFTAIYCVNFGISWINDLSYENMLTITLPFALCSVFCLIAFGLIADSIKETRDREIRKRKRNSVLNKAYKNRNNIIYLYRVPKFDPFKEVC